MKHSFSSNFIFCGLFGWCLECFWTGLGSVLRKEDRRLICNTSLWMFPIYGAASLIAPVSRILKPRGILARGSVYTFFIFVTEFFTGRILKKHNACPWDYSKSKYNIDGLIRLDYAPVWFLTGLIYEKLLTGTASMK